MPKPLSARDSLKTDAGRFPLREMASTRFQKRETIPKAFRKFVRKNLLPLLSRVIESGYKPEDKRELAIQILHNLVVAGLMETTIADSRNQSKKGIEFRVKIWDAIIVAGLANCCLGSEISEKDTRYLATDKLLQPFRTWKVCDIVHTHNERSIEMGTHPSWEDLILLESKQGKTTKLLSFPRNELEETLFVDLECKRLISMLTLLKITEETLDAINTENQKHIWEGFRYLKGIDGVVRKRACPIHVALKQIHSERPFRYARNYTYDLWSAQSCSQKERSLIRIDGEKSTEYDFSGFQVRLLYNLNKLQIDGDAYRPEVVFPSVYEDAEEDRELVKAVRHLVKFATTICFNTKSRKIAERTIRGKLTSPKDGDKFGQREREVLNSFLEDEGVEVHELIRRIEKAHPKIAGFFFQEIAATLQSLDGSLMKWILRTVVAKNRKPALGIHDGVLCKESDGEFVRKQMEIHYKDRFGFEPVIKKVF